MSWRAIFQLGARWLNQADNQYNSDRWRPKMMEAESEEIADGNRLRPSSLSAELAGGKQHQRPCLIE